MTQPDFNLFFSDNSGHYNSRMALKLLMESSHGAIVPSIDDLTLINFINLKNYPEYMISLSHTKKVGAAIVGKISKFRGVGVDIEWKNRPIKNGATKYFQNEFDETMEPLELWVMKEAAFKALHSLKLTETELLKKIVINKNTFYPIAHPVVVGQIQLFIENELMIACAAILVEGINE
jgi:phosphopantetheinyl transferase (holo-ACP synthase)